MLLLLLRVWAALPDANGAIILLLQWAGYRPPWTEKAAAAAAMPNHAQFQEANSPSNHINIVPNVCQVHLPSPQENEQSHEASTPNSSVHTPIGGRSRL